MSAGLAVPLGGGVCGCRPRPGTLPVALLTVRIDDPSVDPALMAFTVDYEAGSWRAEALADHLIDWVVDYALRPREQDLPRGRVVEVVRKAIRATFGTGRWDGVAGEILLHAVCRQFFGSGIVINKVWFKSAANDTYKGFDGVHCVHGGEGLELWLGEAKIYKDSAAALRSALDDLGAHLTPDYLRGEFAMVSDKIDDDHPHAEELRRLMHPHTSLDEVFTRIVVPVLVAYDSAVTRAHDKLCPAYLADLETEVRSSWSRFHAGLNAELPVEVRLFLVPLATKAALLDALDRKLQAWRR